MASLASVRSDHLTLSRLPRAAVLAAAVAIIANVVFFFILNASGITVTMPPDMGGQLTVVPIIISTLVGAIGATVVLAALIRFTRNPTRPFLIISAIFLLVSFSGPLTMAGVDGTSKIILNVMHIIAAAAIVPLLLSQSRKP